MARFARDRLVAESADRISVENPHATAPLLHFSGLSQLLVQANHIGTQSAETQSRSGAVLRREQQVARDHDALPEWTFHHVFVD